MYRVIFRLTSAPFLVVFLVCKLGRPIRIVYFIRLGEPHPYLGISLSRIAIVVCLSYRADGSIVVNRGFSLV